MNNDPRTREAQHNMNTSIIGRVLPTIIEDYGHNRNMDIIVSLSHSLVKDKLTNAKVSGFQVDRNGNFKIIGNVAMDMLIEKDQNRGNYEQARECYFSFTFKGKAVVKEISQDEKLVLLLPKAAEVSQIKIYNTEGEEQTVEMMAI